ICLEVLEDQDRGDLDQNRYVMNCDHLIGALFHLRCMEAHQRATRERQTAFLCPLCRSPVDDIEEQEQLLQGGSEQEPQVESGSSVPVVEPSVPVVGLSGLTEQQRTDGRRLTLEYLGRGQVPNRSEIGRRMFGSRSTREQRALRDSLVRDVRSFFEA